jgi:hypothetical protein
LLPEQANCYIMIKGLFSWKPENYTPEENGRWVWLRSVEWESYPNFLAPLWGIFVVYLIKSTKR